MGFNQGANGIFRCCETEVSYKDFHCVLSDLRAG
jgi:hypothetical protein